MSEGLSIWDILRLQFSINKASNQPVQNTHQIRFGGHDFSKKKQGKIVVIETGVYMRIIRDYVHKFQWLQANYAASFGVFFLTFSFE